MMNENWLSQVLKGQTKLEEKRRLLLTQMGYLRMNIFTEYYERVKLAREKNELNKAVELMNEHARTASIFISTKRQPAPIKRLKTLLSIRSTEPIEFLQKWRTSYEAWNKLNEPNRIVDDKKRMEEFEQLRMAFLELYTYSFSIENFPPLRYRRSDH